MTEQSKEQIELRLNEDVKNFFQNLAEAVRQAILIRTPVLVPIPVESRRRLAQRSR